MPEQPINNKFDPDYDRTISDLNHAQSNIVDNFWGNVVEKSYDPYTEARPYSYNSNSVTDPNRNFERYYSHPSYKKLGFNPWQDNESLYNEQGTALGDIWRATKSAAKLAGTGFVSPLRSYADLFSGEALSPDYDSGEEMRYRNMVGSSSRGGVSGFTSNLITNSGYTFGLIGYMAAETAALIGLEALTGGAATPLAAVRAGQLTKDLGKIGTAVEGINETVKAFKTYGAAKSAWEMAKATGKFINPLQKTTELFAGAQAVEKYKALSDLAKVSKTAGAFYRDLSMANLTLAEAKMEGAMAQTDLEEQLIGEFREQNGGRYPDLSELREIKKTAADAGALTLNWNIPAIYLTNRLTFAPLFKPLDAYMGTAYRQGLRFTEKEGKGIVKAGVRASLRPKALLNNTVNYFKGNLSEGFQETTQEIISGTAKDYYKGLFYNRSKQGIDYANGEYRNDSVWDAVAKNVADQFSVQGFETFASGFLMGGLVNVASGAVKAPYQIYKNYKQERSRYQTEVLNSLNEVYKDPLKFFGPGILNYANGSESVEAQQLAEEKGDVREWLDFENQNLTSQVVTALETNTYDIFLDKLRSIKTMDAEAIKEAYGYDGQEVLGKIDRIIERADRIKSNYDKWNERAGGNPFDPHKFKKDSPEYNEEALGYLSWQAAKKVAIFNESSFERNLERIRNITNSMLSIKGFDKIGGNNISILYDPIAVKNELRLLNDEIEVLEGGEIPGNRGAIKSKKDKAKTLSDLLQDLQSYYATQALSNISNEEKEGALQKLGEEFKKTTRSKLKKSYSDYIRTIAETIKDGGPIDDLAIESSFDALLDLHDLKQQNIYYSQAITVLSNPKAFIEEAKRLKQTFSDLYQSREKIIADGIEFAQSKIEDNLVLKALFERGFVLSPENAEKLLTDKEVPKEFYDTNAKEMVDDRNEIKYREFQQIINPYLEVTKEEPVEESPQPEEEVVEEETPEESEEVRKITIDITERFKNVETGEQLDVLVDELDKLMVSTHLEERLKAGIRSNVIDAQIRAKEKELTESITPENLAVGNVVILSDNKLAYVKKKSKKGITFKFLEENTTLGPVSEENFKKTVKYKYSERVKTDPVKTTVSEQEKVQQNVKRQDKIYGDRERIAELVEEALKDTKKANEEFFEELGCK